MESSFLYNLCFGILPMLIPALIALGLGWLLFRGKKQDGDLSIEGEGALRAEADGLRTRVRDLEGRVSTRDGEVSDLKTKLAAAAAGAAAMKGAASLSSTDTDVDDDETYALEWRNRYLAARVKYLEGRVSEAPKPKAKAKKVVAKKKVAKKVVKKKAAPKKKTAPKKKAAPKKKVVRKAKAVKTKVLYKDGPTAGKPDDLKLIKGIGPKFEKDLNSKGIYYFSQIGNWKAADVKMVEGVIDSIPGRIKRDTWVKQAKGLAKGAAPKAKKGKPGPKKGSKRSTLTATGKKRQKPGPKATKAPKAEMSDMDKYYANVKKHDSRANRAVVEKIVKYCGVALKSRDSSLVACSDKTETDRVVKGFVTKKLGLKTGGEALVQGVCQDMKGERFKSRVTFYYLCAKKAGKLAMFK